MVKKLLCNMFGITANDNDTEQKIKEYTERINQMESSAEYRTSNHSIRNLAKLEEGIQQLQKEREELSKK